MPSTSSLPRLRGPAAWWSWRTCMSKACSRTARSKDALADAGLGQLLRFFETKMPAVGGQAILVDRFLPSTKQCSGCGHVKKRMPLKYRTYGCLNCGLNIDRDVNAAINLERAARRILAEGLHVPVPD